MIKEVKNLENRGYQGVNWLLVQKYVIIFIKFLGSKYMISWMLLEGPNDTSNIDVSLFIPRMPLVYDHMQFSTRNVNYSMVIMIPLGQQKNVE